MPYEVKATPIAQRQIAGLRGPRRKAFDAFVTMLVNEGCRALAYRLTGKEPLPRLCVQHLRAHDRVVVAFEGPTAWVLLVGPHDEGSRRADVYTALYQLAGVDLPEMPRTKPPCRDEDDNRPLSTVRSWTTLCAEPGRSTADLSGHRAGRATPQPAPVPRSCGPGAD